MQTFKIASAQGDVHFSRVDTLPTGLLEVPAENGKVIVTHSETGHHHVMDRAAVQMYRLPDEIYEAFLVVKEPTALEHLRPADTHETIMFEPGNYRVRRQREYTPQGLRRVED